MSREKVIARNLYDQEVTLITYMDGGKKHTDLATDGRVLLSPAMAIKIAKGLTKWAARGGKP